jgi:hypothetical protein
MKKLFVFAMYFIISVILVVPIWSNAAFIEKSGRQIVASDGFLEGLWEYNGPGPQYGNNRVYLAYMDDSGDRGAGGPYNIYVMQYDYTTGLWTRSPSLALVQSGNSVHNAPVLYRNAAGYLEVFYGSISCWEKYQAYCTRRSSSPDQITSWDAEQRIPHRGITRGLGGYTADGSLHLFGEENDLVYLKRSTNGTWSSVALLPNDFNSSVGSSAVIMDAWAAGNTIHLAWSPVSVYYGTVYTGTNIYYARSVDGGNTWRNASGAAQFTRSSLLRQTSIAAPAPTYPSAYLVWSGTTRITGMTVRELSDGSVVIGNGAEGSFDFHIWNEAGGTSWKNSKIDTTGTPAGAVLQVLSDDTLIAYSTSFSDKNVYEYISRNKGSSWTKSTAVPPGGESTNSRLWANVARFPGQRERVLLAWSQVISGVRATSLAFLDRPIGSVSSPTPTPTPSTSSGPTATPAPGQCSLYTLSSSIPQGFASPFNVVNNPSQNMMNASCTTNGTQSITLGNGSQYTYIYKTGYVLRNNTWQQVNYTGSSLLYSNWYVGNASGSLNLTSAELTQGSYFLSYQCQWIPSTGSGQAGGWKCGCRTSACTGTNGNLWQIQFVHN